MLDFLNKYKGGQYSQNGEANIINECLKRMKLKTGYAIEIGAPTKQYCSNIFHLSEIPGWFCYWYDEDPKETGINKKFITPENVNDFDMPPCNVWSCDTDGGCFWIWQAYKGQPDIVVIEINSSLPPMIEHSSKEKGASYISMLTLGMGKGYFLLAHTGNMVMILNKHRHLFPEIVGDGIENYSEYFNTSWQ